MKKISCVLGLILLALSASAQEIEGIGVHAGLGTDVELGIAIGGGASVLLPYAAVAPLEVGLDFYWSSSSGTYTEGANEYTDSAVLTVFAVTANRLYRYDPDAAGTFYAIGVGAGAVNVEWQNESVDDPTYNDSGESMNGGLLIVPGVGYSFGGGLEARLQVPVLIIFGDYTLFSPMLNARVGYRFR